MSKFPKVRIGDDVADGLIRHARTWAVMGFSTEFWKQEVWRALEFESKEAFLEGFLEPYFTVMDPNDLLCMARKWQRGDVARPADGGLDGRALRAGRHSWAGGSTVRHR